MALNELRRTIARNTVINSAATGLTATEASSAAADVLKGEWRKVKMLQRLR